MDKRTARRNLKTAVLLVAAAVVMGSVSMLAIYLVMLLPR